MKHLGKRLLSGLLCLVMLLTMVPAVDAVKASEQDVLPDIDLTGIQVSGKIDSSKDGTGAAYVELWSELPYKLAYSVNTEADTYTINGVAEGTYTLVVRRANCVTYKQTVTAEDTSVTQDVQLRTLGDVTTDGNINVGDVANLYSHIRGIKELTDPYALSCANVNSGALNIADVAQVYSHVRGTKKIEFRNSILPEDIFVRTVDDFGDYRVVNLDEQEDTNFVVYNNGVQELTATATTNVLTSMDEENLIYTFTNPSAAMKALKVGDVFYTVPTTNDVPAVSAKIKEIVFEGNTVTVYSDPVGMEDLFVYIDVDDMALTSTDTQTPESRSASGSTSGSLEDRPFNIPINFSESADNISAKVSCELGGRFTNMRFGMQYSLADLYFSYGLTGDLIVAPEFTFGFEGSISGEADPKIGTFLLPFFPAIKVDASLVFAAQVSGTLNGTWDMQTIYNFGIYFDTHSGLSRWLDPVSTTYGDVDVEMEGAVTLSAGLKFGIGLVGTFRAYLQGDFGWTANGKLLDLEENPPADAPSIHDCKRCIDGKCNFFVAVKVGMEAEELLEKLKLKLDINIPVYRNNDILPKDFYCAFPKDGELEFGWEDCPYERWRTEVKVLDKNNELATDAKVKATFPDGRTDSQTTDSQGEAVLYLPDGINTLKCTHEGQVGTTDVTIKDDVASATIKLRQEKKMFVFSAVGTEHHIVVTTLRNAYPEAEFIFLPLDDNGSFDYNRISDYTSDYSKYGAKLGDIAIIVNSRCPNGVDWLFQGFEVSILLKDGVRIVWKHMTLTYSYLIIRAIASENEGYVNVYENLDVTIRANWRYDSENNFYYTGDSLYEDILVIEYRNYLGLYHRETPANTQLSLSNSVICNRMQEYYTYINLLWNDEWNDYWDAWEAENQEQTPTSEASG